MTLPPLTDILNRLAAITEKRTPGYLNSLNPGLGREALQEILRQAGFAYQPPEEWFALYQWHNGSQWFEFMYNIWQRASQAFEPEKVFRRESLFHYHEFLPMDEVVEQLQRMEASRRRFPDDPDDPWPLDLPNLLPLFWFEGEYYAIECHDSPQAHGRIHFIYHDRCICYDSLHAMLAAKLECHESGIYALDKDGHERCTDEAACAAVLLKYNPVRREPDPYGETLTDAAHP